MKSEEMPISDMLRTRGRIVVDNGGGSHLQILLGSLLLRDL